MLLLSWETVKDIQALQEDVSREEQYVVLILHRCKSSNSAKGLGYQNYFEEKLE